MKTKNLEDVPETLGRVHVKATVPSRFPIRENIISLQEKSTLLLFAIQAEAGPGHCGQAGRGDRFFTHLAISVGIPRDPRQGIVNSAQQLAVSLVQAHLDGRLICCAGLVRRVPVQMTRGGRKLISASPR